MGSGRSSFSSSPTPNQDDRVSKTMSSLREFFSRTGSIMPDRLRRALPGSFDPDEDDRDRLPVVSRTEWAPRDERDRPGFLRSRLLVRQSVAASVEGSSIR